MSTKIENLRIIVVHRTDKQKVTDFSIGIPGLNKKIGGGTLAGTWNENQVLREFLKTPKRFKVDEEALTTARQLQLV